MYHHKRLRSVTEFIKFSQVEESALELAIFLYLKTILTTSGKPAYKKQKLKIEIKDQLFIHSVKGASTRSKALLNIFFYFIFFKSFKK